ncbi:MAG: class I SAM-dependent methyltransferase [Oscillospiraceae bacterium]|jgi:ubiquinone/menaquinone biosynthesis C-methylase UbiE
MQVVDKKRVTAFFDRLAPGWDEGCKHEDAVIERILDNVGLAAGQRVLDIGCGTGVMIPHYLARGAAEVVGVDISPKMLESARRKFPMPAVSFRNADAETCAFEPDFDVCVVYNAFPHFPNPETLVENLARALRPGGTFTIAHGSSRMEIDRRHMESAGDVSRHLPSDDGLRALLAPHFDVTLLVSNGEMLQIVGVKKG